MIRNISVGIDVGTTAVRVVVGEFVKGDKNPKILGAGETPMQGVRRGYISSFDEAVASIRTAVAQAEHTSGIKIKKAYVAVGGMTLRGTPVSGAAVISKADGEVTALDIEKALDDCEAGANLSNKKVLHTSPISFKLDGEEIFGSPEGMRGTKLETKALLITCSGKHLEELLGAISEAGVHPIDVVASPIAGSLVALSNKDKIAGSALVDIGSETTTLAVFENNTLTALHTFSIGGADITNDIALGLKVGLDTAEGLKLGAVSHEYPKKKLEEIIEARFNDIFELIDNYLKKLKRSGLLPAGIVFIGRSANTKNIEDYAKKTLNLPSRAASTEIFGGLKTKLRDPAWFVALGLVLYGKEGVYESDNPLGGLFKDIKRALRGGFKQLLP